MTLILVALTLGLVCAALGGELFVRGSVGVASRLRIPSGIVGATIAAFATSSPEASVSINAALAGSPNIALGDALGSNVVNIGLVFGVALLFGPLKAPDDVARNFLFAFIAPVLTGILVMDGSLSRFDALVLGVGFLVWMVMTVRAALTGRLQPLDSADLQPTTSVRLLGENVGGLILLVIAGKAIVYAAKGLTTEFDLDPFVVGATLVAVGTSIPELATVIISRLRGHDEVGLGAILGSNIFNNMFIVFLAVMIRPFQVSWNEVFVGLLFGVILVLLALPWKSRPLTTARGVLLLAVYAAYIASFLLL